MKLAGICFRGLTKKNPIREGSVASYCFALRRSNSIATTPRPTRIPALFPRAVCNWWWSPQQQVFVSSYLPVFGITTTRSMGSGGSKDKDKKGKAASEEGKQQAQEGQAEKPVSEGTSEQQQKQQEVQVEQTATAAAEPKATMAEEYVEAVVAKASEFGDNE